MSTQQSSQQQDVLVTITEAAANKLRTAMKENHRGIRIGVTGGGCAGLQYDMKPEEAAASNDIVLEAYGVPVFINPMVLPYLKGTTIDFSDDLMEGGFKFGNPNASSSCGCGTSFGV